MIWYDIFEGKIRTLEKTRRFWYLRRAVTTFKEGTMDAAAQAAAAGVEEEALKEARAAERPETRVMTPVEALKASLDDLAKLYPDAGFFVVAVDKDGEMTTTHKNVSDAEILEIADLAVERVRRNNPDRVKAHEYAKKADAREKENILNEEMAGAPPFVRSLLKNILGDLDLSGKKIRTEVVNLGIDPDDPYAGLPEELRPLADEVFARWEPKEGCDCVRCAKIRELRAAKAAEPDAPVSPTPDAPPAEPQAAS